ncbi:MAG: ArgE/DapE family deacylase [Candidatus Bathyarchaeota archaeon]|nr:ArgE/DapE family deacylase [Candidatus Bathyarchaeota archaeon]
MKPTPTQQRLLDRVDADKEEIITFLKGFLQSPSPNPPGDTRQATQYITNYLDTKNIKYKVVGPDPEKPNIVSTLKTQKQGRHLVLNGHIDVFPVGNPEGWSQDPWGGEIVDGKIYGRGACDMKTGTTASIYTYTVLNELVDELKGELTLTAVSDEETGGRLGAGWLVENMPEVMGDCVINGEPSSPYTLRFGEKGILWLRVTVNSKGGHGAYPHLSPNPIKIASKIITELETLNETPVNYPSNLLKAINEGRAEAEKALGDGGADVMSRLSVNIGSIEGGVKINVIPRSCSFELDLRLPPGLSREQVLTHVEAILDKYPGASYEEIRYDGPLWSPPDGEMAETIRSSSRLLGVDPKPIISLGGSDLKFWRSHEIPSYYYGPMNHGMGTVDEYVEVEELMHVVKVHLLSAYEYLTR